MPQQPTGTHTADPEVLAAALREITDRILAAGLGQLAAPVTAMSVILHVSSTAPDDMQRAAVDQLVSVTGQPADYTGTHERYANYRTELEAGLWSLAVTSFVRRPATEIEQLRAENEALRAELAAQAAKVVADVVDQDDEDDDCTCLDIDGYHTCGAYTSEDHRSLWRLATAAERKQLIDQAHAEALQLNEQLTSGGVR